MDYFILILALLPFFVLSSTSVVRVLREPAGRLPWLRGLQTRRLHGFFYVACLLIPFALALASRPAADPPRFLADLAIMALYLAAPAVCQRLRRADAPRLDLLDLITILALWFPIEFDWLPATRSLGVPLAKVLGVVNGLLIYLVIAPWQTRPDGTGGLGYTFRLSWADIKTALTGLAAFAITGIPLGLLSRFLVFGVRPFELGRWVFMLIGGYLFTAVPEEMLFRGVIQNKLERRFPRWSGLTLGLAAVIFGLAHLDNGMIGFPEPNWMYAAMATLAGLAYGWTWRKTGKITASAVTHALVNFVWGILLTGSR